MKQRAIFQVHACNVALIALGLISLALYFAQFFGIFAFESNRRDVDLRPLCYFYVLNGLVGLFCASKLRARVILKILYAISLALSISTIIFYAFTTIQMVISYQRARQNSFGVALLNESETSLLFQKIIIFCASICVGVLITFSALMALFFTNALHAFKSADEPQLRNAKAARAIVLAIAKLILALCTLALTCFVDYEHHKMSATRRDYMRHSMDLATVSFVAVTALAELYINSKQNPYTSDHKLGIGLAIFSSVWCIKSVDNNMFPFFKDDLNIFRTSESLSEIAMSLQPLATRHAVAIYASGIKIGALILLFVLSALSALTTGEATRKINLRRSLPQERFLNALFIIWSITLIVLVAIGLADVPWSGDFIGGNLLWIAALFFSRGVLFSSNTQQLIRGRFVMSVICGGVAIEKLFVSINLVYQSSNYSTYRNENVSDQRTFVVQIILHSAQYFSFFGALCTSLYSSYYYGKIISSPIQRSNVVQTICLCSSLIYGTIFTISSVLFELAKWRFAAIPLELPFYRLANGPFALFVFIVQISTFFLPKLFLAALILQAILGALALFVICPTTTNIFYIYALLDARRNTNYDSFDKLLLMIALIVAIIAALSCILSTLCTIVCLISYTMREKPLKESIVSILKLNDSPPTNIQRDATYQRNNIIDDDEYPEIATHQIMIQPVEEQTLYWSAYDNPYIYKSTKKIYCDDSAYQSSYASPTTIHNSISAADDDEEQRLIRTLEKPPRSGGNTPITKTRIAYTTD